MVHFYYLSVFPCVSVVSESLGVKVWGQKADVSTLLQRVRVAAVLHSCWHLILLAFDFHHSICMWLNLCGFLQHFSGGILHLFLCVSLSSGIKLFIYLRSLHLITFVYFILCAYVRVWAPACHGVHVEVRGQCAGVTSPFAMWGWGSSSSHQVWWPAPFPDELSCRC